MKRFVSLSIVALSALFLTPGLLAPTATAQQKTLKEQLVGTWTLVSNTNTKDGTKTDTYGANPKGILVFDANGRYSLMAVRSDIPKFAAKTSDQGTAEEYKAVMHGMIAHFGTYSVNEGDKMITSRVEGSSFPNLTGSEQKRVILSLTANELKYTNPTAVTTASTVEVTWKRAQ